MSDLRRIGAQAEDRAVDFLLELGYTVVTRRFKSTRGEIDIIAFDGDTLVFVEVKSSNDDKANPVAQVDDNKIKHFANAVTEFLHKSRIPDAVCRFDIIAVTPSKIEHHKAAFRAKS